MIPTAEQCYELMERYGMLDNIRAHSIMVEKIANLLAREIEKRGEKISLIKITAGALMHDIGKTPCLNTRDDHAAWGSEICNLNHLEEISSIVGEHVILKNFDPEGAVSEAEIVYYADKRINHDKVVTIDERLKDLLVRYGKGNKRIETSIEKNFEQCRMVEKKLFSILSFRPEDLAEMI
jgi:uncharacterized protein